ncbi:MAG: hypothetical protein JWM39_397 [Parcubacteria group bacterium]|nr:hypothetical protein [Parcubacteria group bacterium]
MTAAATRSSAMALVHRAVPLAIIVLAHPVLRALQIVAHRAAALISEVVEEVTVLQALVLLAEVAVSRRCQ